MRIQRWFLHSKCLLSMGISLNLRCWLKCLKLLALQAWVAIRAQWHDCATTERIFLESLRFAVSCWPVPDRPNGQQPSLAYIKFRFVRCPRLGRLMPDELRLGVRVLAFAQAGEGLRADGSRKAPLSGKPALPLAMALLVAAPVVLLTRSELPRVVCPRLACREWLRDR